MSETLVDPVVAAAPAKPAGRPFLPAFDGMRGFFGLYIALAHLYGRMTEIRPGQLTVPGHYVGIGHNAIGMFIVISGYVLGLPIARAGQTFGRGIGTFAKRRALRILPAYYAALLLAIPIFLFTSATFGEQLSRHAFVLSALLHVLLLQNISNTAMASIDGPMWSVAVESDMYLLLPLVFVPLARRFGFVPMVAIAFAIGLLPTLLGALHHEFIDYAFAQTCPWFIGLFALGYAAANLSVDPRPAVARAFATWPWGRIAAGFFLATASAVLLTPAALDRSGNGIRWYSDILLGLAIAAQFTADAQARRRGKRTAFERFFSLRPLLFVGTFSYSFYLLHLPIIDLTLHLARPDWSLPQLSALAFAALLVALGVAYVFYRLVERPFMTEYRRRGDAASLRSSAVTEIPDDEPVGITIARAR